VSVSVPLHIADVRIVELASVVARSGWLLEVFRADWPDVAITPHQINWNQLNPNGVTDWHRHVEQTDHLIAVQGAIRLALWDGREDSSSHDQRDVIRFGAIRPLMIVVPPG